jgi:hypothetical protein
VAVDIVKLRHMRAAWEDDLVSVLGILEEMRLGKRLQEIRLLLDLLLGFLLGHHLRIDFGDIGQRQQKPRLRLGRRGRVGKRHQARHLRLHDDENHKDACHSSDGTSHGSTPLTATCAGLWPTLMQL